MAVAGRHDPLGAHGALVIVAALAGIFFVISGYYLPEPTEERHYHYYDDPTKAGIILAMGWAVFGLFVGDWVAWLLVYPEFTFDAAWSSFGRIRAAHTTAVIFGFGGNGLIATSLYVLQRTSRARLPDQLDSLVCPAWLQSVLRGFGDRLHDWGSPSLRNMPNQSGTPTSGW